MANRYWVGGTGTWDTTTTTNWSASSGGASGASVPTAADTVIFDANSNGAPYTVTLTGALTCLDFNVSGGFAVTFSSTGTLTVSGNFTLLSSTVWSATGVLTFAATSSVTLTTNGVSLGCAVTINGVGGTFNLGGAFTSTSGFFTLTNGAVALNNYNLTINGFSSSNSNTRSISFGTGIIYIAATSGLSCTNSTNFTVTGTNPTMIVSYTGGPGSLPFQLSAATAFMGAGNFATEMNFKFIAGTYTITFFNNTAKSVDFTGFSGSWSKSGVVYVQGDVTISSTMSIPFNASVCTFAKNGTQNITTAGKDWGQPIQIGISGGPYPTVVLNDSFTIQSTTSSKGCTLYGGTLNLNGKTLTMGTTGVFTVNDGSTGQTQNITFNGGTIVCPNGFTYTAGNFTTTAGTSPGKISMTGTATFAGGGKTYDTNLSADVAGTITITGANTFTSISNGVATATIAFPASTTTTVTNWYLAGTLGNLCTVKSSTAGTQATLSKVSNYVSSNYLSLQDTNATGGAAWYAGSGSTNVSNNTGWLFSDAPQKTEFLMLFR